LLLADKRPFRENDFDFFSGLFTANNGSSQPTYSLAFSVIIPSCCSPYPNWMTPTPGCAGGVNTSPLTLMSGGFDFAILSTSPVYCRKSTHARINSQRKAESSMQVEKSCTCGGHEDVNTHHLLDLGVLTFLSRLGCPDFSFTDFSSLTFLLTKFIATKKRFPVTFASVRLFDGDYQPVTNLLFSFNKIFVK
jgi:hypothetical protein